MSVGGRDTLPGGVHKDVNWSPQHLGAKRQSWRLDDKTRIAAASLNRPVSFFLQICPQDRQPPIHCPGALSPGVSFELPPFLKSAYALSLIPSSQG